MRNFHRNNFAFAARILLSDFIECFLCKLVAPISRHIAFDRSLVSIAIRIRSYPVAFDVLEFDKAAGFVYGLTKRVPRVVRFKKIEIRIGKRVALRGLVI